MHTEKTHPANLYASQMAQVEGGHGLALWDPTPLANYDRIHLGDVGFIRGGAFHRLYNASQVPQRFNVDPPQRSHILRSVIPVEVTHKRKGGVLEKPRPIYYGAKMEAGTDLEFTVDCLGLLIPAETGVNLSFKVERAKGAALITLHPIEKDDLMNNNHTKQYLQNYGKAIVAYANSMEAKYGPWDIRLADILIVDGVDLTSEWAVLAFKSSSRQGSFGFSLGAPVIASVSASVWGGLKSLPLVHERTGPLLNSWNACSHRRGPTASSSQSVLSNTSTTSSALVPFFDSTASREHSSENGEQRTECVFIRSWRFQDRPIAPQKIRASAGDHVFDPDILPDDSMEGIIAQDTSHDYDDKLVHTSDRGEFVDPLQPVFDYIFDICEDAVSAMIRDSHWTVVLMIWQYVNKHNKSLKVEIEDDEGEESIMSIALYTLEPVVHVSKEKVATLALEELIHAHLSPDNKLYQSALSLLGNSLENVFSRSVAPATPSELWSQDYEKLGHVTCLAFSPDCSRLALGESPSSLVIRDASTGVIIYTLQGHTSEVLCVQFATQFNSLASGSSDKIIRIWDMDTGVCLCILEGHAAAITSIAWPPYPSSRVASASTDGTVNVWDVNSDGALIDRLIGHGAAVRAVIWSDDGYLIASYGDDKNVRLWDCITGDNMRCMPVCNDSPPRFVAFSPSRWKTLALALEDGTFALWDASTGEVEGSFGDRTELAVSSFAYSLEGQRLIVGYESGVLRVYDFSDALVVNLRGELYSPRGVMDELFQMQIGSNKLIAAALAESNGSIAVAGGKKLFCQYLPSFVKIAEDSEYVEWADAEDDNYQDGNDEGAAFAGEVPSGLERKQVGPSNFQYEENRSNEDIEKGKGTDARMLLQLEEGKGIVRSDEVKARRPASAERSDPSDFKRLVSKSQEFLEPNTLESSSTIDLKSTMANMRSKSSESVDRSIGIRPRTYSNPEAS